MSPGTARGPPDVGTLSFGEVLVLTGMGQITPPFGISPGIMHGIGGGRIADAAAGSAPCVGLFALPALALWLPRVA